MIAATIAMQATSRQFLVVAIFVEEGCTWLVVAVSDTPPCPGLPSLPVLGFSNPAVSPA
eukprot:COSAG06_NODE_43562_length_371_cov_0.566176_1_plen_58_part_10